MSSKLTIFCFLVVVLVCCCEVSHSSMNVSRNRVEGHQVNCVPDYNTCQCWSDGEGNSTLFSEVQCIFIATAVDIDELMDAIPLTRQIDLLCPMDPTSHNLTARTFSKHARTTSHLQISSCAIHNISLDTFWGFSLLIVEFFYTSLTDASLPAFGQITNDNNQPISVRLQTNLISILSDFAFGLNQEKNITNLSLNNNQIATVSPRAFAGMENVLSLYLNANKISKILNGTFQSCGHLHILKLSQNNISLIEEGAFTSLGSLVDLDLRGNKLRHLAAGVFRGLTHLKHLNLSYNEIEGLPQGIFDDLTSLEELRLEYNSLIDLNQSPTIGAPMTELATLNISHNALERITHLLLQMKMTNLVTIDFSYNKFKTLRAGAVSGLPLLQTVSFKYNLLSDMEFGAISTTPKLVSVDFRYNQFSYVPEGFVNWFIVDIHRASAISLLLAGNPFECGCLLAYIVRQTGQEYYYPIELDDVEEYACAAPSYVEGRKLMQLEKDQFWCPLDLCIIPGCSCFNRTKDSASVIICDEVNTVSDVPPFPVAIVIFKCIGCFVRGYTLPSDSFSGLSRLETLILRNTSLTSISPGTFSDLSSLETLSLENNHLYELSSREMIGMTSLVDIDLHGNALGCVDVDLFTSSQRVQRIDLSNNNLQTLPDGLFNSTKELQSVRIHSNPFICNCSLLWLKQWMQANFRIVAEIDRVQCLINDTGDVWEPVLQVPDEDFGCRNGSDVIIQVVTDLDSGLLAGVCCSVFIIFVGVIVCVRYRYALQVLFYTRVGIHFAGEEDDANGEFLYDVYLAYSDDNIKEAIQDVCTRLEAIAPPYVVCFRHRDFPIGGSNASNIAESIHSSKRTIVFLSESFLQNEWCLLEFQVAHAQTLSGKRNRLIIILVEDVPKELLSEDIKLHMTVNRCLRMTSRLFWDQLIYALAPKRKQQHLNELELVPNIEL